MATDMQTALAEIAQLKEACQDAKIETQAVRQKLHNAIRKGKALDADKQQKSDEAAALRQELEQARASQLPAQNPTDQSTVRLLRAEQVSLQQRVADLLAQQAGFDEERQQTSTRAAQQEQELESRLHHAQYLEDVAKTKQRELAAQQGECVMLRAALDAARQEAEEARSAKQPELPEAGAEGQVGLLQGALTEVQDELKGVQARHRQELQQAESQAQQLQQRVTAAAEAQQLLHTELQEARQAAGAIEQGMASELSSLRHHTKQLQGELKAAREAELRLQTDLADARAQHENGDAPSESSAAGNSHSQHVDELRGEIAMLHEAMQAAAARIRGANEEREQAQALTQQRASEAAELRRKVAEQEGALSVSSHAQAELQAASEALHEARGQSDELKRLLHDSTQRQELSTQRVTQLEDQLRQALAHSQAAKDVAAAHQAQAAAEGAAAEARADADAQIAHARAQQEAAAGAMQHAEAQVAAAAEAARSAEERAGAAETVAEQLRREDASRRQRFTAVQQGFSRKLGELNAQVAAFDAQAAQHRSSMAALQQAVAQSEKTAAAAKQHAASVDERMQAAVATEVAAAKRQLVAAEAQTSSVKQQLQQVQQLVSDLQLQVEDAMAGSRDSSALQGELSQARQDAESAQADAESLRQRTSRAEGALQSVKAKVTALETEAEKLRGALSQAQTQARAVPPDLAAAEGPGQESGVVLQQKAALQQENEALQIEVKAADKRVAAASAVQHAKVTALEKANQDLSWQVAMLTRGGYQGGEANPSQPRSPRGKGGDPTKAAEPGKGTLAGVIGWVLRHRKALLIAYLALLHILIYQLVYSSGGATSSPPAVTSQEALRSDLQESKRQHLASRKVDPGGVARIAQLEALAEPEASSAAKQSQSKAASDKGTSQDAVLVAWDDVAKNTGGSSAEHTGTQDGRAQGS